MHREQRPTLTSAAAHHADGRVLPDPVTQGPPLQPAPRPTRPIPPRRRQWRHAARPTPGSGPRIGPHRRPGRRQWP